MNIILVRHGQTDHNLSHNSGYAANDAPLNEIGFQQARDLANEINGMNPVTIYSSPLLRCRMTAQFIADKSNIPIQIVDQLKEFDMGDWAMLPAVEAKEMLSKNNAWDYSPQKYSFRVPGGESWEDVEHRAKRLINQFYQKHTNQTIVVVSHHQTIRAFIGLLSGKPFEKWFGFPIENGSIRVFNYPVST